MTSTTKKWSPSPGCLAIYKGRTKTLTRHVRVVAEAIGGYFVVEAIGLGGHLVRLTVKEKSLTQPEASLFD